MTKLAAATLVLIQMLAGASARAQVVLAGNWIPFRAHEDEQDRGPGPDLGDYLGLPINDAARQFAESWDASRLTLQEHQCRVHVAPYIYHGPLNLRIWEEKDPETQQVIAIKNYISTYEQTRTIWMDGRPHPSLYAPHTFMGFSTGKWEGPQLAVTTTHLKQGWVRRNGVPESDQTTMIEHFLRHDKYLTHVAVIWDPVYLAEPMIRTTDFRLAVEDNASWLWPCEYVEEIAGKAKNEVPHYLPGQNAFLQEFIDRTGAPAQAARGGPETIYPEYQKTLREGQPGAASRAEAPRVSQARNPDNGTIEVLPVQGRIFLLAGAGANVTLQVGSSGSLIVDSKLSASTDRILSEVRRLSPTSKPLRYILNTSADPDHVGGTKTWPGPWDRPRAGRSSTRPAPPRPRCRSSHTTRSWPGWTSSRVQRGRRKRSWAARRSFSSTASPCSCTTSLTPIPTATASCSFGARTWWPPATSSAPTGIQSSICRPAAAWLASLTA
jgi:hypothetical protein